MARDDFFFWFTVSLLGAFYLGVAVGHEHGYSGPLSQWQRYAGSTLIIALGFVIVAIRYVSAKMGAQ